MLVAQKIELLTNHLDDEEILRLRNGHVIRQDPHFKDDSYDVITKRRPLVHSTRRPRYIIVLSLADGRNHRHLICATECH